MTDVNQGACPPLLKSRKIHEGSPVMSIPQYGDYQLDIYFDGLEGQLPKYPVDFVSLERKAAEVLPSWVYSYVAGGCGDEGTQRANVDAFSRHGIVQRMRWVRPSAICRCHCST